MKTAFAHIVQRRLSRELENVATESLAYILETKACTRTGLMKVLREVAPALPDLRFHIQHSDGASRPDMWGYDGNEPRVFIENKFWAELTSNQPEVYLGLLAARQKPTVLLIVVPEARQQTIWRELMSKLKAAAIKADPVVTSVAISHALITESGPILALVSWVNLLQVIQRAATEKEDQAAIDDLMQLRALCQAADTDLPITEEDVRDQRTPAMLLLLGSVIRDAVETAVTEKCLYTGRLQQQAYWERVGRYVSFRNEHGPGAWLGLHFGLWRTDGESPLWAIFSASKWGRALEVRWSSHRSHRRAWQDRSGHLKDSNHEHRRWHCRLGCEAAV